MKSTIYNVVVGMLLLMALPAVAQANRPPVSVIVANPLNGTAPLLVNFDGSQSTDDRGIFRYRWNFGDGTTALGRKVNHTYSTVGNYIARLTVVDRGGLSHSSTVIITVNSSSSSSSVASSLASSSLQSSTSSQSSLVSSSSSSFSSSSRSSSSVVSSSSLSVSSSSSVSSTVSSFSSSSTGNYFVDCITGSGPTLYVNASYTGPENGSKTQPYKKVQSAVNAAANSVNINVAQGGYSEAINIEYKRLHLCGGWSSDFSVRNPEIYPSVLTSANATAISMINAANTSVIGFTIRNSKLAVHVQAQAWPPTRADSDPLLAGNIIENNGNTSLGDSSGGVLMEGGYISLTKNIIRNNQGSYGSALYANGIEAKLQANRIESNLGGADHGGAIYAAVNDIYVYDNVISGNEIGAIANYGWGGGMIILGRGDLKGNKWTNNYSPSHGGALFVDEGAQVTMSNDLFYNNRCSQEGGDAIALDQSSNGVRSRLTATNITVVENHSCRSENAILLETGGDLVLKNSIIWSPLGTTDIYFQEENSTAHISYSNYRSVTGAGAYGNLLTTGPGNISADPVFANSAAQDYHLQSIGGRYNPVLNFWEIDAAHSPAIDAGDPASSYSQETSPHGGRINMGVYGNTVEASRSQ